MALRVAGSSPVIHPIINDTPSLNRYGWIEVSFFSESIERTAFKVSREQLFRLFFLFFLNNFKKDMGEAFGKKDCVISTVL